MELNYDSISEAWDHAKSDENGSWNDQDDKTKIEWTIGCVLTRCQTECIMVSRNCVDTPGSDYGKGVIAGANECASSIMDINQAWSVQP